MALRALGYTTAPRIVQISPSLRLAARPRYTGSRCRCLPTPLPTRPSTDVRRARPGDSTRRVGRLAGREAARPRSISELGVTIEGSALEAAHRGTAGRARRPRPDLSAALLVIGRMVLSRRRPGRRHPLLPRPPAAGTARTQPDARGRGRHARMVHEDPAPRSRTRDRQRLQAAAAPAPAADLRPVVHAVPGVLHAEAVQQELRPASRQLVRAEPPRRGLRRDVRGVAESQARLAEALRGLAGARRSWNTWTR